LIDLREAKKRDVEAAAVVEIELVGLVDHRLRVDRCAITARTCDITFGTRKRTLTGREANEVGLRFSLQARRLRAPPARTSKAFRSWNARLNPNEIMKKASGGAEWKFKTGQ
jgi:hypothetical protein